jgi:putative ATP-dependent endonuclease of OLD family
MQGAQKMIFNKLIIRNFKQFEFLELELNEDINIIAGDNESGKSTILEALALVTTGRFCGRKFESFLSNDIFNCKAVAKYIASLSTAKPLPPPTILIELYVKGT